MKTGLALWAGSELSHQQYVESMYKAENNPAFKADANYDTEVMSRVMHVDNGVAVINIAGSLVDGSAGYAVYYGVLGYDDIRAALASAVSDPEVGSILLNVRSGGGAVSGCHECSQLIGRVGKVKPVVAYTGGTMQSAALWLGSQAQHIVAGETAIVGGLGIVMVHVDRSEQLKAEGIKATVIRAGTDKALGNPYEALSDKAEKVLQGQADSMYNIFLGQVANGRGVTAEVADDKYGQGVEFLGKAAKKAGLVDATGSYEDAMLKAQSLMKKRPKTASSNGRYGATNSAGVQALAVSTPVILADNLANLEGKSMTKQSLSAEQLVAMAAGIVLEQPPAELTAEEVTANAAAAEVAATAAALEAETKAPVEALASGSSTLVSEAVTLLQGMLASANTDLVASRAAEQVATAALATAQAQAASFTEIARASVRTMGLHFGVSAESASAMSASEVLSEHTRLAGMFQSKFKAGGVAATVKSNQEADASVPTMSIREQQIAMKLPR